MTFYIQKSKNISTCCHQNGPFSLEKTSPDPSILKLEVPRLGALGNQQVFQDLIFGPYVYNLIHLDELRVTVQPWSIVWVNDLFIWMKWTFINPHCTDLTVSRPDPRDSDPMKVRSR